MRTIFSIAILTLTLALQVHAAPMPPTQVVRAEPVDAKKGERVSLEALVYNNMPKTVTVSVLFATPTEEIETIDLVLPTETAKTATTVWIAADGPVPVTASVVKAVDASQKNVPELLGIIGTVTVGKKQMPFSVEQLGISAQSWLGTAFSISEPWRLAQAKKYTQLRNATRAKLGINDKQPFTTKLAPKPTEAPALPGDTQQPVPSPVQPIPLGSYAVLIGTTALAAFFTSVALFYISVVLFILLLLRLFIRLFT